MICVEVFVNGEPVCTADGAMALVSLLVNSGAFGENANHLRVSGFPHDPGDLELAPRLRKAMQKPPGESLNLLHRSVAAGDEITIRIVDRPEGGSPAGG